MLCSSQIHINSEGINSRLRFHVLSISKKSMHGKPLIHRDSYSLSARLDTSKDVLYTVVYKRKASARTKAKTAYIFLT
jgi:hypothetical protein